MSLEMKQRISIKKKGSIPWNKGIKCKKLSKEHKRKNKIMKSYDTYNKKGKNEDTSRMSSISDFFRKEINETRTFTRNLTANKSYSPKTTKLVRAGK